MGAQFQICLPTVLGPSCHYDPESVGQQFLSAEYITDSSWECLDVKKRGLTVWTNESVRPQAIKNTSVIAESVARAVESP
jgi:hypothetical protein